MSVDAAGGEWKCEGGRWCVCVCVLRRVFVVVVFVVGPV